MLQMSALELGRAIRAGDLSPLEATRATLKRIQKRDRHYNAFIRTYPERALEQAAYVQAHLSQFSSPLAGVPMALKDNICTKGLGTSCASKMLENYIPPYDAAVCERLEDAGCILLGKLNMDAFAMGSTSESSYFGPVKNPWSPAHVPGGSSGGAAAAVAAGEAFFALGSDSGGSVRLPAAFCGLTGLKPSYGRVSRYGLVAYASSLEQIGPIARSAADCAAVLDLIAGPDARDSQSLPQAPPPFLDALDGDLRGLRIGLPEEFFAAEGLDPLVCRAVLAAGEVLKIRGAVLEYFSFPLLKYALSAYYILACAQAGANLARFDGLRYGFSPAGLSDLQDLYLQSRSQGFGPEVQRRILLGTFVLSAGYYEDFYQRALRAKAALSAAFRQAFSHFDLLLCPVSPGPAPRLGEAPADPLSMYLQDLFTVPANLAGLPALSMPCGFDGQGLPLAAQLIGPYCGEARLLNAAHAYQLETDHHRKCPKEVAAPCAGKA